MRVDLWRKAMWAWSQVFGLEERPSFDQILRDRVQNQDRVSLRVRAFERALQSDLPMSAVRAANDYPTPKRSQE